MFVGLGPPKWPFTLAATTPISYTDKVKKRNIVIGIGLLLFLILLPLGMTLLYARLESPTYPLGLNGELAGTQIILGHLKEDPNGPISFIDDGVTYRYSWIPVWDRVSNGYREFFSSFSHGVSLDGSSIRDTLFPSLGYQFLWSGLIALVATPLSMLLSRFIRDRGKAMRILLMVLFGLLGLLPPLVWGYMGGNVIAIILMTLPHVLGLGVSLSIFLKWDKTHWWPLGLASFIYAWGSLFLSSFLMGNRIIASGALLSSLLVTPDNHVLVPTFGYNLLVLGLFSFLFMFSITKRGK